MAENETSVYMLRAIAKSFDKCLLNHPLCCEYWCNHAADKIEQLQAIVDKLPKCWRLNEHGELVQDEPMHPGMEVWWIFPSRRVIFRRVILVVDNDRVVLQRWRFAPNEGNFAKSSKCYLTRKAAEAARKK
jgi:hypothetical protein